MGEAAQRTFVQAGVSKPAGNAVSHRFQDTFAGGTALSQCTDRTRVGSAGPSNRPHHRETLQPPGTLAARAARAWERDPLLQSPAQVTAVQKNTGYKTGTGQLAGVTSL